MQPSRLWEYGWLKTFTDTLNHLLYFCDVTKAKQCTLIDNVVEVFNLTLALFLYPWKTWLLKFPTVFSLEMQKRGKCAAEWSFYSFNMMINHAWLIVIERWHGYRCNMRRGRQSGENLLRSRWSTCSYNRLWFNFIEKNAVTNSKLVINARLVSRINRVIPTFVQLSRERAIVVVTFLCSGFRTDSLCCLCLLLLPREEALPPPDPIRDLDVLTHLTDLQPPPKNGTPESTVYFQALHDRSVQESGSFLRFFAHEVGIKDIPQTPTPCLHPPSYSPT